MMTKQTGNPGKGANKMLNIEQHTCIEYSPGPEIGAGSNGPSGAA
jgi:hypothetical protein